MVAEGGLLRGTVRGTLRRGCLDQVLILGGHIRSVLTGYARHCHGHRPVRACSITSAASAWPCSRCHRPDQAPAGPRRYRRAAYCSGAKRQFSRYERVPTRHREAGKSENPGIVEARALERRNPRGSHLDQLHPNDMAIRPDAGLSTLQQPETIRLVEGIRVYEIIPYSARSFAKPWLSVTWRWVSWRTLCSSAGYRLL